jgi:hypothetical protein
VRIAYNPLLPFTTSHVPKEAGTGAKQCSQASILYRTLC